MITVALVHVTTLGSRSGRTPWSARHLQPSNLHAQLVFVTKYRPGVFTPEILTRGEEIMHTVCADFGAEVKTLVFGCGGCGRVRGGW